MMLHEVQEFTESDSNCARAIFDAALERSLKTKGFCIKNLMWEVFCMQLAIEALRGEVKSLQPKKKSKQ